MKYNPFICLFICISVCLSCNSQKQFTTKDLVTDYDLEKFLWSKNKDSILVIHKKSFKKICRRSKTGYDDYFGTLYGYCLLLTSEKIKTGQNLTFPERAKVAGYAIEYLYRCKQKFKANDPYRSSKFVNRVLAPWNANQYNEEFKKHDYYGLPLLKQEHLKYFRKYHEEDPNQPIKNYTIE